MHRLTLADRLLAALLGGLTSVLLATAAHATEVQVVGVFPGKAVVSVNGAAPATMSIGQVKDGVKLLGVADNAATIEVEGKRRTLALGQGYRSKGDGSAPESSGDRVVLTADSGGHFKSQVLINGKPVTAVVDTGATLVAMDVATAKRLGIDFTKGQPGIARTANGAVPMWLVKLDTVKLGDLLLYQVDGAITEGAGIGFVLLGNSFLSRTSMKQDAGMLTLIKK